MGDGNHGLVVGVATGIPVEGLYPWSASARRFFGGRIVVLTDQPLKYLSLEHRYGVELCPARLRETRGVCDIVRTRWEALAELLEGETGPVCFVDTRDAVFQGNPLLRVRDKLVIGSEGKVHRENGWSWEWVRVIAPEWYERIAGEDILCAGAIGGPAPLLRELALAVFHRFPKFLCDCETGQAHMGDQALVNVLLRESFREQTEVTTDWVFHVMSLEYGRIPADIRAGWVVREDGERFAIVHQVDRTDQLPHFAEIA